MGDISLNDPIDKPQSTVVEVPRVLIDLWKDSPDPWAVKDLESRYLYANSAYFAFLNQRLKSEIEGRVDNEISHPIADFASHFLEHDRKVQESLEHISSLDIYPYGREKIIQPYICEKRLFYNDDRKCIGIILHSSKLRVFSALHFLKGEFPNSLVTYPPEKLFIPREPEVIFHALQGLSCKEIANQVHLTHRTIENKLQVMYQKVGVNSLRCLKECCREKGFDKYIPLKLLRLGSRFIDPDSDALSLLAKS